MPRQRSNEYKIYVKVIYKLLLGPWTRLCFWYRILIGMAQRSIDPLLSETIQMYPIAVVDVRSCAKDPPILSRRDVMR